MSRNAPPPSPAELARLEQAFASDSSQEAYHPLGEAYLALGRHLEAMVVCRKGVRSHPTSPKPRVLMARIHEAQGRLPKALEEVGEALKFEPDYPEALALAARLHLKNGDRLQGETFLLRAASALPSDPDLAELAAEHGIDLPESGAAASPGVDRTEQDSAGEEAAGEAMESAPAPKESEETTARTADSGPAEKEAEPPAPAKKQPKAVREKAAPKKKKETPQAGARPSAPIHPLDPSSWDDDEDDEPTLDRRTRRSLGRLGGAAVVMLVVLVGWGGYSKWKAEQRRERVALHQQTIDEIRKDTFQSLGAATEAASRMASIGGGADAHALLAYLSALRWGEHGEGDHHRLANEHLKQAQQGKSESEYLLAAEALIDHFEGRSAEGQTKLREATEEEGRVGSGLLLTTLGRMQMWAGDLDEAARTLLRAQRSDSNSVRLLATLAEVHRRRSMDRDAWTTYDSALRYGPEHVDSLLGKALLILDADDEGREEADKERLLAEAESQIERVLSLPGDQISLRQLARAEFAKGLLLFAKGDEREGARLEREALARAPNDPDLRVLRGRRLLRAGDAERAAQEFREALRLEERLPFHYDLYQALRLRDDGGAEALRSLEAAEGKFPRSGRLQLWLGDAHLAMGKRKEAQAAYERALRFEGEGFAEAHVRLAGLWREAGDWAKAEAALDDARKAMGTVARGPTYARIQTERGRIMEEGPKRDLAAAFDRYAEAIDAAEGYADAWFYLGRLCAGQRASQMREQAVESLQGYLRLAPRGEHAEEARRLLARLR